MNAYDKLEPDKSQNKISINSMDKNIILMYDDIFNKIEEYDIDTLKKLLTIYFSIHLKTIKINNIEIQHFDKFKNNSKFKNDVLKRGTLWLHSESIKNITSNNIYIYIGVGYIKDIQNCIVVLWNDRINNKQCYYTINKSRVHLLKNMNRSEKLIITNLIKSCFNEVLTKKQLLNYTNF